MLLAALLVVGLVGAQIALPTSAMGQGCTTQDKLRLYEQGYDRYQVEAMCNPRPAPPPRPIGYFCMTNLGPCRMMQAIPIGETCVCYTPYGTIPGIVQ